MLTQKEIKRLVLKFADETRAEIKDRRMAKREVLNKAGNQLFGISFDVPRIEQ
jgi:hypothetical protein